MPETYSLRPCTPEDDAFLFEVYAAARRDELQAAPWSDEQRTAFLEFQHKAQQHDYRQRFAEARFQVILSDGEPVGRFFLHHRPEEIRILDLAFVPDARANAIAEDVLRDLLREADETSLPVRIYLEPRDPLRSLFDRLGFRKIDEYGTSHLMEHRPG